MVYRLVGSVYVMVIAASAAPNVFYMMRLVEGTTRVLVAASRGVEVTQDKLMKRYPEVTATVVHARVPL